MITPLPIHFKTPGRSYSQIGRKGNIALYAVYSDYFILPGDALPFALIGYELIAIKIKNRREIYPPSWLFGESAWSIPKRFAQLGFACVGSGRSQLPKLLRRSPKTVLDRSTASATSADLAPRQSQTDQTTEIPSENATKAPQERVALR